MANINAVYCAFEPSLEDFETAFVGLFMAQLMGANITAPFKERAPKLCTVYADDVKIMGTANTISKTIDGELLATNTDGRGLILDLDNRAQDWRENAKKITIIGAGGAARNIIPALLATGAETINIVARNIEKAKQIDQEARKLPLISPHQKIEITSWDNLNHGLKDANIVINATTIGLKGDGDLDIDFGPTKKDAIIYEMIYAPLVTKFYQNGAKQGRFALNGIGMLVGQGALAFETWFNQKPDFQTGLDLIEAHIKCL